MQKRLVAVVLIAFIGLLISGCTLDPRDMPEVSPENGFWDRYLVYPLYVAIDWFTELLFNNYG